MTKNESEILLFIKSNPNVEKTDVLKKDFKIHHNHVIAALTWLHRVGYVSTSPVCPEYTDLQIVQGKLNFDVTAKGLHALDEYFENQTRLDKAEKDSKIARRNACIANVLAAASLIATAGYLKPLIEKFLSHMLP